MIEGYDDYHLIFRRAVRHHTTAASNVFFLLPFCWIHRPRLRTRPLHEWIDPEANDDLLAPNFQIDLMNFANHRRWTATSLVHLEKATLESVMQYTEATLHLKQTKWDRHTLPNSRTPWQAKQTKTLTGPTTPLTQREQRTDLRFPLLRFQSLSRLSNRFGAAGIEEVSPLPQRKELSVDNMNIHKRNHLK